MTTRKQTNLSNDNNVARVLTIEWHEKAFRHSDAVPRFGIIITINTIFACSVKGREKAQRKKTK
jgi:hypothetical protein